MAGNRWSVVMGVLGVSAVLGTTPGASGAQQAQPAPPRGTAGASDAEIVQAVDSVARRVMDAALTPALGVAVVRDGRTIFSRAYGMADASKRVPADDRTLWYVASTSKSFTGFGVSLLATQGALDFSTPITTLLPHARWPEGVNAGTLTLAHFLSHTHYLNDNAIVTSAAYTGAIPESRWPELLRFARPSGSADLVYSNLGYNVAAMVIDARRPEGWRRYLDSAVYRPAGLGETYARTSGLDRRRIATNHELNADGTFSSTPFQKTDETMNSAGGHVATLRDLARWITVQMDSGVIDGKRVFPAAAVRLSQTLIARQTREPAKRFAFFDREGWGAGWDIGAYEGERMVSRFGGYGSIRSHISFLPTHRVGVVAQVNGSPGATATDVLAALVYDLDAGRPEALARAFQRLEPLIARKPTRMRQRASEDSVRASRQRPLQRPLSHFAGSYANEAFGAITFEMRNDTLWYRWGVLSGPAEVFDASRNALRIEIPAGGTTVTFDFAGSGPATGIQMVGERFVRQ